MKAALAFFSAWTLICVPTLGMASSMTSAKVPPLHGWLLSQRVNACFPWFLWNLTLSTNRPANDLSSAGEAMSYHVDDPGADELLEDATKELRRIRNSDMVSFLNVVYDGKGRAALFRQQGYEQNSTVLMTVVGAPPVSVAPAGLASYRSKLGVRLGMTSAAVAKTFGKAGKMLRACGMTAFGYAVSNPPPAPTGCGHDYAFVFKNDRLVAVSFSESC